MNCKLLSLLLLISVFMCAACNDGAPPEVKTLQEEAMRIHDDVMPKMSNINKTRRKLKGLLKENPERSDELLKAIKDLESADEAMMNWMAAYKKYNKLDPGIQATDYYKEEIKRITMVRLLMLSALDNGTKLLNNE